MQQCSNVILSIIAISHNQRDELKRCLDSILAMALPFPYEIIVSDDRSTDGSLEMAQRYAHEYPECCIVDGIHYPRIIALACNSDDCSPANNSQRSGYNRCNAYPYASGKYIAHVDADDYFRSQAEVYRRQVEALEQHPDCSLAMSSVFWCEYGQDEHNAKAWLKNHPYHDGDVFSSHDFIAQNIFIINQAFLLRKNSRVDPVELYGKRYVDSVITYHHMQFGKIVYVEACDYVYVQHSQSVTGQMSQSNLDSEILWCLPLYIGCLIPCFWKDLVTSNDGYWSIRRVIDMAISGYRLTDKNLHSLEDLHVWIYDCFTRDLGRLHRARLLLSRLLMKIMKKFHLFGPMTTRLLRFLLFYKSI